MICTVKWQVSVSAEREVDLLAPRSFFTGRMSLSFLPFFLVATQKTSKKIVMRSANSLAAFGTFAVLARFERGLR